MSDVESVCVVSHVREQDGAVVLWRWVSQCLGRSRQWWDTLDHRPQMSLMLAPMVPYVWTKFVDYSNPMTG